MKLVTKRLILRNLKLKDAKDLAKNANDKTIGDFTATVPYPYGLKDAKWFINECIKKSKEKPRDKYEFGIELKKDGRIIGVIGIFNIDNINEKAEVGYWIGKKYRKLGLMFEAERKILNFAFKRLKINKMYGDSRIENKGSNKLFKKFGFRKIGTKEEEFIKKGKKMDVYAWELLKKHYNR